MGITGIARTACELLEWKRPGGGAPADHGGDHALFKELLDRHHYLGYRVPFGAGLEDGGARCLDRLERW